MNPDVFFENFELLADAPNGVQKLRELILQLAVRGKLVPQDPNDEPTSELLERINAEKKNFVRGNIKKSSLLSISSDEILYEIPSTWVWTQLTDVYDVRDGTHDSPKYSIEGFPLVTSKNLSDGYLNLTNIKYISETDHIKISERSKVDKDDVLFAMIGSIGNPVIVDVDIEFSIKNVALFKYYSKELSVPRYLRLFLEAESHNMRKQANGGVQSFVSLGYLRKYPFPLPPLAEQKRIVSKVDELMALCDKLEARRQKKQEIQSKLNSAALDRMLSGENQEEFEENWQCICENFDLLYDNPECVEKLKQAILQLAVQGKLVPHNSEDEPASVLIKKIKEEKKRYAEKHNLREKEPLPPVEASEEIFKLPVGWTWSRIGEAFLTSSGTTPKRSNHDYFIDGTENWVKTTDLNNGVVTSCEEKITPDAVKDCNLKYYPIGTVCVAMYGGAGTIGKSGILGMESTINQSVCGIYPNKYVSSEFLHCYVKSIRSEWMRFAAGLRKDPNINGKIIDRMVVPLPPLAEQKYIVEKVEQLMGLCDEFEAKLSKQREDREKLMEAVVKCLLEGAVTEKPELEKPIPLQAAVIKLK